MASSSTPVTQGAIGVTPDGPGVALTVRNLTKHHPGHDGVRFTAVDDVSFDVGGGDFFTLLGPSGCGKTTTLRMIAGLEYPDQGEIVLGERTLYSASQGITLAPNVRDLGMVFQSYAIWPHMTVLDNVTFPLRSGMRHRRLGRRAANTRGEQALAAVRLDHLAGRAATDLSGGQQQRLALARAIALEPPLLLLDEPLSNLDSNLRSAMRVELQRLQRELGITTIYVTHDQGEALAMSTKIAVMRDGKIAQTGTPRDAFKHPNSEFVARFLGDASLIDATVQRTTATGAVLTSALGPIDLPATGNDLSPGTAVLLCLRPDDVSVVPGGDGAGWHGRISTVEYTGSTVDYRIDADGLELLSRVPASHAFEVGDPVRVLPDLAAAHLIPRES